MASLNIVIVKIEKYTSTNPTLALLRIQGIPQLQTLAWLGTGITKFSICIIICTDQQFDKVRNTQLAKFALIIIIIAKFGYCKTNHQLANSLIIAKTDIN